MLGVMIDCSRNAVMTVDAVKDYVDLLAKMGYDTLMLYTEDTYEVNDEPYFGYMRGKYTKEEMKELDAYCQEKGMELIPCVQTLAHLNAIFKVTNTYENIRDCDDILLVDNERTFELIEHIFATLSECFTTRKVHIGMDEADKVGLGKYLKKNGYQARFDIINNYLHKVCAIAEKYGFHAMIWSDMFCQLALGSVGSYRDGGDIDAIREKAALPENVSLVHWDYYNLEYEKYANMLQLHKAFNRPIVFAGGSWTWKGFMPDNQFSIDTTRAALRACRDNDIDNIFTTMWGDDGAECSRFSILPALLFTAEAARGNEDMDDIKQKFYELTGMQWDDFMLLDSLDDLPGQDYNPSKYLIYNDPFMGLNDYRVFEKAGEYYKELGAKLAAVKVTPKYRRIFDTAIKLCEFLTVKAELGIKTRAMYKADDKAGLKKLATEDYTETIKLLEAFYETFAAQWKAENKPFGFDVQDLRIGGLLWRLKKCSQRLIAYVNGEVSMIPELEEELLEGTGRIGWNEVATPNVLSHTL